MQREAAVQDLMAAIQQLNHKLGSASPATRERFTKLIQRVVQFNPEPRTVAAMRGTKWELLYADTPSVYALTGINGLSTVCACALLRSAVPPASTCDVCDKGKGERTGVRSPPPPTPQKVNKYAHLEVLTGTLTQLLWHTRAEPVHPPVPSFTLVPLFRFLCQSHQLIQHLKVSKGSGRSHQDTSQWMSSACSCNICLLHPDLCWSGERRGAGWAVSGSVGGAVGEQTPFHNASFPSAFATT